MIKKTAASFKSFILVKVFYVNANLSYSYCDIHIHTHIHTYILALVWNVSIQCNVLDHWKKSQEEALMEICMLSEGQGDREETEIK